MTDYNPFAERQVKHPTNNIETIIHLCKGSLGSGILAMPRAFYNIGLWLGVAGTLLVGILCTYSIHMLIRASQALCFRCKVPRLTYAETMEQAFLSHPKEMIKTGIIMRLMVNLFIVLDCLGSVCIYFVNVSLTLHQILYEYIPEHDFTIRYWILILAVPMVFLCLIRNLKFLVPFSLTAHILLFTGLIITFFFIFSNMPNISERPAVVTIYKWPIFFGISIFALENIAIVLPCENEMKQPERFTGCPSVLVISMTIVISLYTILGFFGYLKYGDSTYSNITLNIPTGNVFAQIAKISVGVCVYFTILLQYYVAIRIILEGIKEKIPEKWQNLTENAIRICVMLFCVAIAIAFPDLGPFISLIGAVCLSSLGLIFPAILDIIVFHFEPGWDCGKLHIIKDIFIIIFGLIGFVTGAWMSLAQFKI